MVRGASIVAIAFLAGLVIFLGVRMAQVTSQASSAQTSNMVLTQSDSSKLFRATSAVPDLSSLQGLTEEEALAACGRGPSFTEEQAGDGKSERICTYALTHDKVKAEDGEVDLILGFNKSGHVVMAGFRAPFSVLGFGSLSMSEATGEYRVLQSLLEDAGITVDDADVVLPEDSEAYSTYESDRVTVVKQFCTFSGSCVSGDAASWEGTLCYDYEEANETRNLAYTKRWAEIRLNF